MTTRLPPKAMAKKLVRVLGFAIVIEQFWLLRNYAVLHKYL